MPARGVALATGFGKSTLVLPSKVIRPGLPARSGRPSTLAFHFAWNSLIASAF